MPEKDKEIENLTNGLNPLEEFLLANGYVFQDQRELIEDHDPFQGDQVFIDTKPFHPMSKCLGFNEETIFYV